ncbi:MAG: hypothetical protein N3I86_15150 [Verrucomicrobiae bacterium]|nr:hypothetical protein [Verrucomicrobiae bacterium]
MRNVRCIVVGLWLCALWCLGARSETFELTDGQTLTGDIVSWNEAGLLLNLGGGKYERFAWTRFSQATLKALAQRPKLAPLVEPFIEIPVEQRIKKTEVVIKPVERLELPARRSLLGALFGSSVGLVVLLLLYAANLYAAYEISILRAYPAGLVCGLAAVAPVIGPAVFLCLPTRIVSAQEWKPGQAPAHAEEAPVAPEGAESPATPAAAEAAAAAPKLPPTQVFARGQFTFNRRFFETKFPGLFGLIRRDAEKDMVLLVKSARGEFVAHRITRITANEIYLDVRKGAASQEVSVPFTEIREVQYKHKDA